MSLGAKAEDQLPVLHIYLPLFILTDTLVTSNSALESSLYFCAPVGWCVCVCELCFTSEWLPVTSSRGMYPYLLEQIPSFWWLLACTLACNDIIMKKRGRLWPDVKERWTRGKMQQSQVTQPWATLGSVAYRRWRNPKANKAVSQNARKCLVIWGNPALREWDHCGITHQSTGPDTRQGLVTMKKETGGHAHCLTGNPATGTGSAKLISKRGRCHSGNNTLPPSTHTPWLFSSIQKLGLCIQYFVSCTQDNGLVLLKYPKLKMCEASGRFSEMLCSILLHNSELGTQINAIQHDCFLFILEK